ELNPLEQFWLVVKNKQNPEKRLQVTESLQSRIVSAANKVLIQHLENIIKHSKNQFINCLNHFSV
ncbi:MAG: hypothetical protein EXX96DRAFT_463277, partial [Benjaminiella poitrasii]